MCHNGFQQFVFDKIHTKKFVSKTFDRYVSPYNVLCISYLANCSDTKGCKHKFTPPTMALSHCPVLIALYAFSKA